jgi:hypothetical protein
MVKVKLIFMHTLKCVYIFLEHDLTNYTVALVQRAEMNNIYLFRRFLFPHELNKVSTLISLPLHFYAL